MNMEMDVPAQFSTRSLPLAAFLFAREASFVKIDRRGNIVYFIFANCDDLVQDFYSGGKVAASSYWSALQTAKDLIFAQNRIRI